MEAAPPPPIPSPSILPLSGVARKCRRGFSLPLEVGTILRLGDLGERLSSPSESGLSPAAKRFLVHFKHYFHQERIEKQLSNSKIRVLIYNRRYRVLHNKVRAILRRKKTKFLAKKNPCTIGGISPPGSKWRQFASFPPYVVSPVRW